MPLPAPPEPRFVYSADGVKLATYEFGDPAAATVFAVHGFASSALGNWQATGWIRDLGRAGFHIVAFDQRGHGASDKPHSPAAYRMEVLVADAVQVLDAYLLDDVNYLGYSLGSRVGWHAAHALPDRIKRAVLGGIPEGDPLTRFQLADARAHIEHGTELTDKLTFTYLDMARRLPGNDLTALVALVEGLRGGPRLTAENGPTQPTLVATGGEDPIVDGSRRLAAGISDGVFVEIPGRHHFNAPTSGVFRRAAVEFLSS